MSPHVIFNWWKNDWFGRSIPIFRFHNSYYSRSIRFLFLRIWFKSKYSSLVFSTIKSFLRCCIYHHPQRSDIYRTWTAIWMVFDFFQIVTKKRLFWGRNKWKSIGGGSGLMSVVYKKWLENDEETVGVSFSFSWYHPIVFSATIFPFFFVFFIAASHHHTR